MNNDLNIPVAYCFKCKQDVPVLVLDNLTLNSDDVPEELKGASVTAVICPICEVVLNSAYGNCQIRYYSRNDLAKLGWVVEEIGTEEQ